MSGKNFLEAGEKILGMVAHSDGSTPYLEKYFFNDLLVNIGALMCGDVIELLDFGYHTIAT